MLPLDIKDGLPYLPLRPYTDKEYAELPMVVLTADGEWDPSVLDNTISSDENWFDAVTDLEQTLNDDRFDAYGNYRHRVSINESHQTFFDAVECSHDINDVLDTVLLPKLVINKHELKVKDHDYDSLRPYFAWAPTNVVKATLENTTQFTQWPASTHLKNRYKSPFPALNVLRRHEPVATDTVFADTPAVDSGATCAQIFVGTETLVTDAYGIKSERQFVNTLEDNIRQRGAPTKLISDRAQVEISNKVKDILRALFIQDWQSEPHQQHQNFAERRIQTLKTTTNRVMDRVGAPAYCWLLCLMYVSFLLNLMAVPSKNNMVPLTALTNQVTDCSAALCFSFWDPVYYKVDDNAFPSTPREDIGCFVGVAENVGHQIPFKILNLSTIKVIICSDIHHADTSSEPNWCVALPH